MVEITNGIDVIEVTDGAYNSVFKSQGYRLVKAENKVLEKTSEDQKEESKVVDLEQKPVSQWSKQEIALFAEVNGIDLSGTKNVNEMFRSPTSGNSRVTAICSSCRTMCQTTGTKVVKATIRRWLLPIWS